MINSIVMSLSTQTLQALAFHTRANIGSFFEDIDKIDENTEIMMIVFVIPIISIAASGLAEAIVRNLKRKCHHIFEIKRGHEDEDRKTKITTCVQFCRSTTLCFLILSSSECCDGYGGGNDENLMLINSVHYGESYYYCKWENNLSL